jgi:hypothetical protein
MTVKELATLLEGLPPETPVLIHLGWTLAITETDIDPDGLILFADDTDVAAVNRLWLAAQRDGPGLNP